MQNRVNWPTALFLIITPIVGIAGTAWWAASGRFHWATVGLMLLTWGITAMGITAGYHRLFSHRAYRAGTPLKIGLLIAGAAAWEGSALTWCRDHRRHHQFVDTDDDPYNINRGFWWAHMGWLLVDSRPPLDPSEVPDLREDPLLRLQHRLFIPMAILFSFLLPWGLAALWGDPWGGLLVAATLRIVLNHHSTFFINSLCHMVGNRPYSDAQTARDNWLLALVTHGEGYHNFHHEFAADYRNGILAHQWDPTKWLIWTCATLGLASNLRRTGPERIARRRMQVQMRQLDHALQSAPHSMAEYADRLIEGAREQVHQAGERLKQLREQYLALKKSGAARVKLAELRRLRRDAERELAHAMQSWQRMTDELLQRVAVPAG